MLTAPLSITRSAANTRAFPIPKKISSDVIEKQAIDNPGGAELSDTSSPTQRKRCERLRDHSKTQNAHERNYHNALPEGNAE